jgi:large subunit ribosomal protein L25
MQTVAIEGTLRSELTKSSTKAIRREEGVPCVIYGGDQVVHFYAHKNAFSKLIYTPDFKLAEITVEGTIRRSIVKDIQFHPVSDEIQHIDFVELVEGKPLKMELPINVVGNSPGVKVGGKLLQNIRKAKVLVKPESLVDSLTIDISSLELGKSVRIRDMKTNEGVTITTNSATPVATIEIPRALRSAMNEAAKADVKAKKGAKAKK